MAPSPLVLHFGRYRDLVPPLASLLRERRDARLREGGLAALLREPIEVVVASRALAQAIAAEILRLDGGGAPSAATAGIEMRSLEALARRLVNGAGAFPRIPGEDEQRLAMAAAVADAKPPLAPLPGLVPLLLRSWRDLRDGDAAVAAFAGLARGSADRDRIAAVAHAWKRFESGLGRIGATDAAEVIRGAAAVLDGGGRPAPQIVAGFYDVTAVQERLLFALHRAGALDSVWIPVPRTGGALPPAYRYAGRFVGAIERLARAAAAEPEIVEERIAGGPSRDVSRFPTDADELAATFARIGGLIDRGTAPQRIGVVARALDERTLALAAREARAHGVPLAARTPRPLTSHPLARAIRDLLRVRGEGFPRDVVIELAGAPFRSGELPAGSRAAELDDAARRAEIAAGGSAQVRALIGRLDPDAWWTPRVAIYADLVAALERLTAGAAAPRRPAAWGEWIESVLARLRVETEEDLDALAAIGAVAAALRRADPLGAPVGPDVVIALLASAPDLAPPAAEGPAVWLGDVMGFRGRSFEHLFAIGMRQDLFPQRRREDLLFTNAERRRIGVREIEDGRLEERLLFALLADGATESLHLSWSSGDGMRNAWRPSPFLKELALEGENDPARRSAILSRFDAWVDARPPALPERPDAAAAAAAALRGAERLPPLLRRQLRLAARAGTNGAHDGILVPTEVLTRALLARLGRLSPGRLEVFGHCPQRYLLETILRIEPVEEPEIELEIGLRKKGTLDHTILERFYRDLPEREIDGAAGSVRLPPHLRQRLERIVTEEFDRYDALYPAPSALLRRIERRVVLRSLAEFLVADLDDLAATGLRPWRFETTFGDTDRGGTPELPAARIAAGGAEIVLRGRIDRIDRARDGSRIRVVDYKLGGGRFDGIDGRIEEGHLLQLPLYALAAVDLLGVAPAAVDAAIKPIRGAARGDRYAFSLGERHEGITRALGTFVRAMLAGRFPAVVSASREDHCRYCALERWCRTRHSPEESWAVRQYGSALALLGELDRDRPPGEEAP